MWLGVRPPLPLERIVQPPPRTGEGGTAAVAPVPGRHRFALASTEKGTRMDPSPHRPARPTLSARQGRGRATSALSLALALTLALGAALALLAGTPLRAAAQDPTETNATLRAVHALAGGPAVDILLDGQPLAQAVEYGAATEFAPVPPGEHQLQVVPAGQPADAAVVDETVEVEDNRGYLFLVTGTLDQIESRLLEVDIRGVEEGRSRARLINAVPDAETIAVGVTGGDTLFDGIDAGSESDYEELDPGSYSLDLRGPDDQTLLQVPELEILSGRAYDIVALGQVATQDVQLLPLVTPVSPPCAEVLGLGDAEDVEQSCVRVVHASPDAPAVDVYLNDSTIAQNLPTGSGTEYLAIPAGEDQQIRVVATGGSPDDPVAETEIDLEGRYAYQVIATGTLDDLELNTAEADLSPMPETQARLRVVHAAADVEGVDVAIAEGETLFEGVDFRDTSDYVVIDAGSYALELRPGGEETVALRTDVTLESGMVYDAIAIGRASDQSLALLVLASPAGVRSGAVATPAASPETTPGAAVAPTAPAADSTPMADSTTGIQPTPTPVP